MAAECLAAIHLCAIRVTRLEADGSPTPGPNNSYVTNKPIQLGVTPVIEAGQDRTLVGGCDCLVATYRGFDKLKRFDLELDLGTLEPGLIEMLIGADAIIDTGVPIGDWWPSSQTFACGTNPQPNVAIEAWQDGWADDAPDADFPYIRWIFPSSFWQIGAQSLQNDFLQPKLSGFTRGNPEWGLGIYGDQPEAAQSLGGFFYDTTRPDGACGYATANISPPALPGWQRERPRATPRAVLDVDLVCRRALLLPGDGRE